MKLTHLLALVMSLDRVLSMVLSPSALPSFLPSLLLRTGQFGTKLVHLEEYLLQSHKR